jgi:hypothetical protein
MLLKSPFVVSLSNHERAEGVSSDKLRTNGLAVLCGNEKSCLQWLPPGKASVGLVPVGDLRLAPEPAEVYLSTLSLGREVHQPSAQVSHQYAPAGDFSQTFL